MSGAHAGSNLFVYSVFSRKIGSVRSIRAAGFEERQKQEDGADGGGDHGGIVARLIEDQGAAAGILGIVMHADLLARGEVELLADVTHVAVAGVVVEIAAAIAFPADPEINLHQRLGADVGLVTLHQETLQLPHDADRDHEAWAGTHLAPGFAPQRERYQEARR